MLNVPQPKFLSLFILFVSTIYSIDLVNAGTINISQSKVTSKYHHQHNAPEFSPGHADSIPKLDRRGDGSAISVTLTRQELAARVKAYAKSELGSDQHRAGSNILLKDQARVHDLVHRGRRGPQNSLRHHPTQGQDQAGTNMALEAHLFETVYSLSSSKSDGGHEPPLVGPVNEELDNQEFIYTAAVRAGSDDTKYNLLVDTGSANTWLGAKEPYHKSARGIETENQMAISYGTGSFEGVEYFDDLILAPGLTAGNQSIGVAKKVQGFRALDGVMGLGPAELTRGTIPSKNGSLVPTILDTLYDQGTISSKVFGIGFQPVNPAHVRNGVLTWGGIDYSIIDGEIAYLPLTTVTPASQFWGINLSITYGNLSRVISESNTTSSPQSAARGDNPQTQILNYTPGIVDCGTSLILLPSDAYNAYVMATGAVFDWRSQLLKITPAQYEVLQSLYFQVDGATFEFPPNAQIWPRTLNWFIGGTNQDVFLIIGHLPSHFGPPSPTPYPASSASGNGNGNGNKAQDVQFVLGYVFLERFYSVFDAENGRLGLAKTKFTYAETN